MEGKGNAITSIKKKESLKGEEKEGAHLRKKISEEKGQAGISRLSRFA